MTDSTASAVICSRLGASFVSDTLVKNARPHPGVVYYKPEAEFSKRNIHFYIYEKPLSSQMNVRISPADRGAIRGARISTLHHRHPGVFHGKIELRNV